MKKSLQLILLILFFANNMYAQKYHWRKISFPVIDTIPFNNIDPLYASLSPDSSVYISSNKGVYVYNNGLTSKVVMPINSTFYFNKIVFESANNYWIGSDSGLYHWTGSSWNIYDKINSPFKTNYIVPVKHDSLTGKTYFCDMGNPVDQHAQLCIYDGTSWSSIDSSNSPIMKYLYGGADVDNSGNIYLASIDTLAIYNGSTWKFILSDTLISPSGISLKQFTGLKAVNNGQLIFTASDIFGQNTNLIIYDLVNSLKYFTISYTEPVVNPILKFDSNGNLWYSRHPDIGPAEAPFRFDGLSIKGYDNPNFGFYSSALMEIDKSDNIWHYFDNSPSFKGFILFNENGFNTISGNVFIDNNSNGVKDAGEVNQKNILVHEINKNLYCNSDTSGYFLGLVDTSGFYNVELITPPYWAITNSPSSYSIAQTHNNEKNTGIDFGIAPIGLVNDLFISGTMLTARPGMNSMLNINYKNVGNTIISDTISLSLDSSLTYVSANPAPTVVSGNYLQWAFSNLQPFDQSLISLNVNVSSSVTIGTTLNSYAHIGSNLVDTTPLNNWATISRIVTGSFDPNQKEVNPVGTGVTGDVPLQQQLTYTVQFQNTGNDTAFKVVIKDSIDVDLDLSTFNLVGYSHPVSYKINSERLVTFTFNNILLPDSTTNELLSHGFVKYTVSPLPNAVSGKQIKNVAGIYFDFNSAVETNTTLNTLSLAAGIPSINYEPVSSSVYPNPFITQTKLSLNGKSTHIKIYDLTGRDVTAKCILSKSLINDWTIKNKSLQTGIYIYKVFNNQQQIATGKLNLK